LGRSLWREGRAVHGHAPECVGRMGDREHWEAVYGAKAPQDLSWYRPHLDRSLKFIDQARLSPDAAIIDVGGGASTLVDDLLARGDWNITVLDLSEAAIARTRTGLGSNADRVKWIAGDITRVELPRHRYDFWHDRAVFHFLVEASARERYVSKVRHALKPGG